MRFDRKVLLFGAAALAGGIVACSIAPTIPVVPTNRNVLAEVVFTDTT
ncbi:MAG: hypothetical protein R6X13_01405 [bacterium]